MYIAIGDQKMYLLISVALIVNELENNMHTLYRASLVATKNSQVSVSMATSTKD